MKKNHIAYNQIILMQLSYWQVSGRPSLTPTRKFTLEIYFLKNYLRTSVLNVFVHISESFLHLFYAIVAAVINRHFA